MKILKPICSIVLWMLCVFCNTSLSFKHNVLRNLAVETEDFYPFYLEEHVESCMDYNTKKETIVGYHCSYEKSQYFKWSNDGTIRSLHDINKCLVASNSPEGKVYIRPCDGSRESQQWYYDKDHTIGSFLNNKCLDFGELKNGNEIRLRECSGNSKQKFIFDHSTYQKLRLKTWVLGRRYRWDCAKSKGEWLYRSKACKHRFAWMHNDVIKHRESGKCITMVGDDDWIEMKPCTSNTNQKWYTKSMNGISQLCNSSYGKCIGFKIHFDSTTYAYSSGLYTRQPSLWLE